MPANHTTPMQAIESTPPLDVNERQIVIRGLNDTTCVYGDQRDPIGQVLGLYMQFTPIIIIYYYTFALRSSLLKFKFYFFAGKLWCLCRMFFLPVAYLYGKKFVGPITPTILALREEIYNTPYNMIDWSMARGACAKVCQVLVLLIGKKSHLITMPILSTNPNLGMTQVLFP